MYHGQIVTPFNDIFIFRTNVNSSNMLTRNNGKALYIPRFHIDAFERVLLYVPHAILECFTKLHCTNILLVTVLRPPIYSLMSMHF